MFLTYFYFQEDLLFLVVQLVGPYLVPRPGIEPGPLAVRAQCPNHWTAREFPS